MRKLIVSIIAVFGAVGAAFAQDGITFEVGAPTAVEAGELFRVEFVVNNAAGDIAFIPPTIEGFEIMGGPSESYVSNVSLDFGGGGGGLQKVEATTYTYVLQGFSAGLHTISAAHATVKGKSYSTKPITIEVVGKAAGQGGDATTGGGTANASGTATEQGSQNANPAEISSDDIFVRAVVNRSKVYKGEPVVVTLKLYSRVPIVGLDAPHLPTFNGFWKQDISPDDAVQGTRETYNDRIYETFTLQEYLLYPQQSGELTVDSFEATVIVRVRMQNSAPRDIFDALMGNTDYEDVRKKVSSPPVRITVNEWPAGAPAGFDGAVGEFELTATPPPASMNANASSSYTLRLSGTGNFPLIGAPKLTLPASFEEYNVTTSDNMRHLRTGTSGYREFSYPFIPRTDGLYTIPALEFSYFDPREGRYRTLSTKEMSLNVTADTTATASPGNIVSGISREELEIFGQDIQFIKRGAPKLRPKGKPLMWSPLYISSIGLLAALFVVGLVVMRKYVRNMQSDRFVRGKRANKVALKRFRAAETSMKQGDKPGFYDEMLKALWGYMSDKLDIPMSNLTKDRIREELFERNVPEARSGEYIRIISECEEAQYSPAWSARMNELYHQGVTLVSELEAAIKKG